MWRYLWVVMTFVLLIATAAAQQPDQLAPLREAMLASESRYYLAVAQDYQQKFTVMSAESAKTAAYWAEYVKGLPPHAAELKK